MPRIPSDIRNSVASTVIQRAIEMNWDDLTMAERSRIYEEWVDDAQVGGQLIAYIPRSRIRVWIKDGPMKEYARARRGLGPYAQYVTNPVNHEREICERVLGQEWSVVTDSIDVKPAQFRAIHSTNDSTCIIYWGTTHEAKHLLWAALNTAEYQDPIMVIVGTRRSPIVADERSLLIAIARRASIRVEFISL